MSEWEFFLLWMIVPAGALVMAGLLYIGTTRDRPWF